MSSVEKTDKTINFVKSIKISLIIWKITHEAVIYNIYHCLVFFFIWNINGQRARSKVSMMQQYLDRDLLILSYIELSSRIQLQI